MVTTIMDNCQKYLNICISTKTSMFCWPWKIKIRKSKLNARPTIWWRMDAHDNCQFQIAAVWKLFAFYSAYLYWPMYMSRSISMQKLGTINQELFEIFDVKVCIVALKVHGPKRTKYVKILIVAPKMRLVGTFTLMILLLSPQNFDFVHSLLLLQF